MMAKDGAFQWPQFMQSKYTVPLSQNFNKFEIFFDRFNKNKISYAQLYRRVEKFLKLKRPILAFNFEK